MAVLEPQISPAFAITYFCNHYNIRFDLKLWGHSDPFFKNLNQRSLTPRWPLTPSFLRSHVWLYPWIIVTKSHENSSKYVDTVTLFWKTWTKGHRPLDDLWPHVCWRHMCDSTQGSLCPRSIGIHQCMWIQWSILQKNTTYYVHTTYTYYVQNEWSHSLFLNSVQTRQKCSWWTTYITTILYELLVFTLNDALVAEK